MENFERRNDVEKPIEAEIRCEGRHTVSFLDLPRELRELIYRLIPHNSGTFTYDTRAKREIPYWSSLDIADSQEGTSFEARYGNSGVAFGNSTHRFAILATCRAIHSEALPILYATTPLGFWRPMYDWNGQKQYPEFVAKVFKALPVHATKHITTLQLQGELWLHSMETLLITAMENLPSLRQLEIGLDPYHDLSHRKYWFDHRAMLRQSWPSMATLHLIAQRVSLISIAISPPRDVVHINAHEDGVCVSQQPYQRFLWQQLQFSVLCYEISIHGALLHKDAKAGMEYFMDHLVQRPDLLKLRRVKNLAKQCIDGTCWFRLKNERDWLKGITGRVIEVDEVSMRVTVVSERGKGVKWCRMVYTSEPRGYVVPGCDVDGEEMERSVDLPEIREVLEVIDQRLLDV